MSENPAFGTWEPDDADGVGWNEDGSPDVRPTLKGNPYDAHWR